MFSKIVIKCPINYKKYLVINFIYYTVLKSLLYIIAYTKLTQLFQII